MNDKHVPGQGVMSDTPAKREPGALFTEAPREGACQACGRKEGVEVDAWGLCLQCRGIRNSVLYGQQNPCCGCGKALVLENFRVADGCPCNSPRGVNHGLVPPRTCTCPACDPQTGSTRYAVNAT